MPPIPTRFHLINTSVCFTLSCLLNGALLLLVAKRTTSSMATYRPILLLCTCVDLVYSAVLFVVRPVLITNRFGGAWLSTGPLRRVPQPYNFALLIAFFLCRSFSTYSVAAPFLFRYAVVVKKRKWGLRAFLAILLLPMAASVVELMFRPTGLVWTEEDQRYARNIMLGGGGGNHSNGSKMVTTNEEEDVDSIIIAYFVQGRGRQRPYTNYVLTGYCLTYAMVVYCGWRIYRHLTRIASGKVNDGQYRTLQNQLSTALLLQAVVPLVVGSTPSLVIGIAQHVGATVGMSTFNAYSTAIVAWFPVANAVIALWVIKAYRESLLQWAINLLAFTLKSAASVVHPVAPTMVAPIQQQMIQKRAGTPQRPQLQESKENEPDR